MTADLSAETPLTSGETLTSGEAAVLLSSGHGEAGQRLRRAVESQLQRRGVGAADRDDIRADVGVALLLSTRSEPLTLDAACAHVARIARNKAVDLHRRGRREAPHAVPAERAPEQRPDDLDPVSGEVHRRDVSRALVQFVRELPNPERLALTATATGAGHLGSGLGRSSHYRALDRARLRLSAAVRSRVAGWLALPALLLRTVDHARSILLPVGATAVAAVASLAFVLPAVTPPTAAYARATVSPTLARVSATVARQAPAPAAAPAHVVHRRVRARSVPAAPVAARRHVAAPSISPPVPDPVTTTPAAGLDPCRAAQLCQ